MTGSNRGWVAVALLLLMAAAGAASWYLPPGWNWIAAMALLLGVTLLLGEASVGRALGILITERKLMSLSRFQMIVWTVLIASAFLVIALERIRRGDVAEPLAIGVGWQVWALLGISTTSFVGSPLVNGNKQRKDPGRTSAEHQELVGNIADTFREPRADVDKNRAGVLYGNDKIQDARFTDLFEGDELVDVHLIDVGKLQLFLFTVIIAMAYGLQLFQLIAYNDLSDAVSLPTVNDGLLALLGVSHAGYLGTKGVTHTPTLP